MTTTPLPFPRPLPIRDHRERYLFPQRLPSRDRRERYLDAGFSRNLVLLACLASVPATAATCEELRSLKLPDTTITNTRILEENYLPAYCEVAATIRPTADSEIKIEVWLPLVKWWNGKYQAVGNGGWSGAIVRPGLELAVRQGYAASSTDTGHEGSSASFALGHPEKLIDYAYRSEHEMTVKSKAIIRAFYGSDPKLSYWNGCSAGGKQAMKEAQRFPEDFDGIVAGAPAQDWIARATLSIWVAQAVHKNEASYIPPSKYEFIHKAALEACDATDGLKDGVIEDPTRCSFDPKTVECKGADALTCLTAPQVEAARKIYAGPGQGIAPGLERGSELGWGTFGGPDPLSIGLGYFKYVVFQDPNWNFQTLNFDSDIVRARKLDADRINATDLNLGAFRKHGGKLLQYHGWSDPQIPPASSVDYYKAVLKTMGTTVPDFYRLFMVPGMAHCGGGAGVNKFDMLGALEQWVEHNQPPGQVLASGNNRTRPLCPFPQVARYKGSGNPDEAANFTCK
jgi:feruloyl esterase